MSISKVTYYNGTTPLRDYFWMNESEFSKKFPGQNCIKRNGFFIVGHEGKREVPVTRIVSYKKYASLHKCDARCTNARPNGACECSCGGVNHGLFTSLM